MAAVIISIPPPCHEGEQLGVAHAFEEDRVTHPTRSTPEPPMIISHGREGGDGRDHASKTSEKGPVCVRDAMVSASVPAASRPVATLLRPSRATFDAPRRGRRPAWPFATDRGAIEAGLFAAVLQGVNRSFLWSVAELRADTALQHGAHPSGDA